MDILFILLCYAQSIFQNAQILAYKQVILLKFEDWFFNKNVMVYYLKNFHLSQSELNYCELFDGKLNSALYSTQPNICYKS